MKKSSGQALLEALFVVVFTTIIMFCFLQICIMVVDDMTLNEAAFVGMRSAAVIRGGAETKTKEAKKWVENYLLLFYPLSFNNTMSKYFGNFAFSDYYTVAPYYRKARGLPEEEISEDRDKAVTVSLNQTAHKDYSDHYVYTATAKIYYSTRVMFRRIVASQMFDPNMNIRYSSSRSRLISTPDSEYIYKAYPGARKFDE